MFLQHLSPLLSLPTFAALWLTILDFMDKYMHAGSSDLLVRSQMSIRITCIDLKEMHLELHGIFFYK